MELILLILILKSNSNAILQILWCPFISQTIIKQYTLSQTIFFKKLEKAQNILIAGVGGGFDIFSGLPLYFNLIAQGKKVHLANFSFTHLSQTTAQKVYHDCYQVLPNNRGLSGFGYFPEKVLAEWFLTQDNPTSVFAFEKTGVKKLRVAYNFLIKELQLDAIILVDGGTDSLMFGDEQGLGTLVEDSTSLAAVFQSSVKTKLLSCLGFGVDYFHGVSHYHFLENVAKLSREGGYLGCFHLLPFMLEAQKYKSVCGGLCQYADAQLQKHYSQFSSQHIAGRIWGLSPNQSNKGQRIMD
ncbi:MAG: DUF1152 domain-containing protein [Chitinophagales bacterium]